jgi:DNA polymerase-1
VPYLIFDGHSLLYRSYFALLHANLTDPTGAQTGAVTGFLNTLAKHISDYKPEGIAVAFDLHEPTFRHELSEDYKKGRRPTPVDLISQVDKVRQLLEEMNIKTLSLAGYEADDLLATAANELAKKSLEVYIVTGDRDLFQLVRDPLIKVLYISTGKNQAEIIDEQAVKNKIGVSPQVYPLYLALKGDPSDAIKGVPSIGQKTAISIVNKYQSIKEIYSNLNSLPKKIAEVLLSHEESLKADLQLSSLKTDLPVEIDPDELSVNRISFNSGAQLIKQLNIHRSWEAFVNALKECQLSTQNQALPGISNDDNQVYAFYDSATLLQDLNWEDRNQLVSAKYVLVLQNPSSSAPFICKAKLSEKKSVLFKISLEDLKTNDILELLLKVKFIIHSGKQFIKFFLGNCRELPNVIFDTDIGLYLINPDLGNRELSEIGNLKFLKRFSSAKDYFDKLEGLYADLNDYIKSFNIEDLFYRIEMPLLYVLAKMEHVGILVDKNTLQKILTDIQKKLKLAEKEIFELVGKTFNINSTKELQQVLFSDLKLSPVRKIKSGYSTDQKTLLALRKDHPVIDEILKYRELEKLRSTYAEPLINYVGPDSRIHATFIQTSTRTGRIASENPNLQNIPIRSQEGELFRKAFVAPEGFNLLVADYNQIELRIIAHLTEDENLMDALAHGQDVHKEVAAKVFNVNLDDVTETMRSKAKMVSYGLAYGMEPFGLSQRLGIDVTEAQMIIDSYFTAFPGVKRYMEKVVEQARKEGFTQTLLGRKRFFPELSSKDYRIRSQAERAAINAPIQGLAADIFKTALVRIDSYLNQLNKECNIVLQVHDEILIEVPYDVTTEVLGNVSNIMRSCFELKVPLMVNISYGKNWLEAKKGKA